MSDKKFPDIAEIFSTPFDYDSYKILYGYVMRKEIKSEKYLIRFI